MASSKLKSMFKASLEEIQEGENEAPAVLEGGDDSLEAELIAVQESEHEADDAQDVAEELDEVAEGLESISEYMRASLEHGGLEPSAAGAVALAVESYTRRLGIDSELIPSQESFGGASDREHATTVSIEAVGEKLKAIWEAIKKAVKKAWKAVITFFTNIFSAVNRAETRVKKLQAAVGKLGDKKSNGEKIEVSKLFDDMPKGSTVVKLVEAALDDLTKAGVNYFSHIGKLMVDGKVVEADSKEEAEEAEKSHLKQAYAGLDAAASKLEKFQLPGGAKVEVTRGENDSLSISFNSGDLKGTEERAPLDVTQMNNSLKVAGLIIETLKKRKDRVKELEKASEAALKNADIMSKKVDQGRVGKWLDKGKARSYLGLVRKGISTPIVKSASYGLRVSSAYMTAVERSLKTYK